MGYLYLCHALFCSLNGSLFKRCTLSHANALSESITKLTYGPYSSLWACCLWSTCSHPILIYPNLSQQIGFLPSFKLFAICSLNPGSSPQLVIFILFPIYYFDYGSITQLLPLRLCAICNLDPGSTILRLLLIYDIDP